jgi:hypothetical protein
MANAAFTALLADIYTITDRADLVSETTLAVRTATLKLHQSDFYPRDLVESKVQFNTADYFQALAYKALFPQMRKLEYMRKYESGAPTGFLDVVTPTNVLDSYGIAKEDICYLAGEVIQIRSSTAFTDVLIGFYQNPTTAPDTYASWIDDLYHFAIVTEAAASVFKMIGKDEEAAAYKTLAGEQFMLVRNSNILA